MFYCPICSHKLTNEKDKQDCERSCETMITIYMEQFNLSRNEAKERFLMELL